MCWCVGGQTANMAEKGVTASGYGTEYAWQILLLDILVTQRLPHPRGTAAHFTKKIVNQRHCLQNRQQ